jgi:hypothetical protein
MQHPLSDIDSEGGAASVYVGSDSGGTSVATSSNDATQNNKTRSANKPEEQEIIAKEEDTAVFRLKLLVLAVLVISTVGITMVVYLYTSDAEEDDFEAQIHRLFLQDL